MPFESIYSSTFDRLLANSRVSDTYSFKGQACWEWTGYRIRRGYGRIAMRRPGRANPQGYAAHRVMAECVLRRSLDPNRETIEHRCEIPFCIFYGHFSLVTRAENTADMRARVCDRPRRLFTPLIDPALYYIDPIERSLPQLLSTMYETEEAPF